MAANDRYQNLKAEDSAPSTGLAAVTPSDSVNLPDGVCRGLWIGGSGDVVVDTMASSNVKLSGANAGQIIPVAAIRVRSTGTTASLIVAMY
jgi:hypothetical protein